MNENIKKRNKKLLETVKKNLEKRHFNVFCCQNKEEVIEKIIENTSKEETFSWGGSVTLEETGIIKYLKENNYNVLDRESASTPEEKQEIILKSIVADNFLMSTNAMSTDGELVNIDGHANRVSALCFGPKKVFVIVGINKIEKSLEDALSRARNFAAPANAQRVSNYLPVETPCLKTGTCMDCKSETCICAQIVITRLSRPNGRINVILVNENLGF